MMTELTEGDSNLLRKATNEAMAWLTYARRFVKKHKKMSSPQLPIPMAKDVARAIGGYGEKIENRSLLLEKFPIHKEYGHDRRFHDASRHSFTGFRKWLCNA